MWIYILTTILLSMVILSVIYLVPTTILLKNLIIKIVKIFVWCNIIILIILAVFWIKYYFTEHKKGCEK